MVSTLYIDIYVYIFYFKDIYYIHQSYICLTHNYNFYDDRNNIQGVGLKTSIHTYFAVFKTTKLNDFKLYPGVFEISYEKN